MMGSHELLTA